MVETDPARALSDRVARGALSTLGATLVGRGLAMAQSVAVARLLDPYRVGLFAIVSYVMSVVGTLCDLGLPVAVITLTAEDRASRPHAVLRVIARLLRVILSVSFAVAAALFVGADRLAALYREPTLTLLFRLGAIALVFSVAGAFRSALLQGFQQIPLLAMLSALNAASMLVLTVALTPWLGLPGIILASILTEGVAWLVAARPLRRTLAGIRDRPRTDEPVPAGAGVLVRAFHVAAPSFLNALTLFGSAWFLRSYLAHVHGWEAVGLFQVGDSLTRVLMLVSGAIAVPLVPAVAEAGAPGAARLGSGLEIILRCVLFVTLPGAAFLALGGRAVLGLVFGHAYAGAGEITAWLAFATVFQALANVLWSTQVGGGRVWAGFAITAVGQALIVIGAVALTPAWGLGGLGAAVLAGQTLSFVLAAHDVGRRLHTRFPGLMPLLPLVACGGGAVIALVWLGAEGLATAVLLAAGVVFWQMFLLRPAERRLAWDLVGRLIPRAARGG